jgi:hypothetical protein
MRLAGEEEQHRTLADRRGSRAASRVLEQQGGALVSGETAGEADGQDVRVVGIGEFQQAVEVGLGAVVAGVLLAITRWRTRCSICALSDWCTLQNWWSGMVWMLLPATAVGDALAPARSEKRSNSSFHSCARKVGHVHAVGDVGDRVVVGFDLRPQDARMRAETPPWMRETPLWKREPRIASAVMLNSLAARHAAEGEQLSAETRSSLQACSK